MPVESIAECLQVAFDSGGQRVVLPMSSAMDIPSILPPSCSLGFTQTFMQILSMRCLRHSG